MGQQCGWDDPGREREREEAGRRVFLPKMVIPNLIIKKPSDKSKSGYILLNNGAGLLKNVSVMKDDKKGWETILDYRKLK